MNVSQVDKLPSSINVDLVTQGLTELSILRRNKNIYPSQHPSIAPSARKVVDIFSRIVFESGSITIGIAKDALLVGDMPLERKNPVFQDVAKQLFAHNVAAVTILPDLEMNGLLTFVDILNTSPEHVLNNGGFAQSILAGNIRGIQVTEIDYGAFRLTDEDIIDLEDTFMAERAESLLWERFVRGVLNDVLDQAGSLAVSFSRIDPAMLAELINNTEKEGVKGRTLSYAQAIVSFFRKAKQEGSGDEIEKIGQFINNLAPKLRKEFLVSTLEALKTDRRTSGKLMAALSGDAIFDAMVEMNNRGEEVSPYLRSILQRLDTLGAGKETLTRAEKGDYDRTELVEKLKTIMKDDETELYLPGDYETLIRSVLSTGQIPTAEMEEREMLLNTLVGHPLELKVNAVVLNLLEQPSGEDRPEVLKQHTFDMLAYYINIGDYHALCGIYNHLSAKVENPVLRQELLDLFATEDFTNEVLTSISIWGKAKYNDIQSLIKHVGIPFLNPTLERLAEEESMSLRRFYMERLREFDKDAIEPTVARLRDERWYVVRNMLVLLRALNATQTVSQVRRLLSHPNPRVHQEALRTLIYFQDPEADRQLQMDLKSENNEAQLTALQLAETSKSPQVMARLLEMLKTGGNFELKNAVLRTLAAIGNPVVLPELAQLLKATNILHPILMHNFKMEIVRSLERYPAQQASQLLSRIPELGDKELTRIAAEISRKNQARQT